MKTHTLLFSALAFVGLYLLSFGPAIYLTVKADRVIKNYVPHVVSKMVVTAYLPHLYTMAYTEIYFNYGKWWVEIAGEKVNITYPNFRAQFLPK